MEGNLGMKKLSKYSYDEKEHEGSKLLRIWEEWPTQFLDEFRTPKQIDEGKRRRRVEK